MRRKWPWGVVVVVAIGFALGKRATSSYGSVWFFGWLLVSTVAFAVADMMHPKPTEESRRDGAEASKMTDETKWRWSRWWVVPAILTILTLADAVGWLAREQYTACGTPEAVGSRLLFVWLGAMTLFALVAFILGIVRIVARDYSGFIWLLLLIAVVVAWSAAVDKYQCSS